MPLQDLHWFWQSWQECQNSDSKFEHAIIFELSEYHHLDLCLVHATEPHCISGHMQDDGISPYNSRGSQDRFMTNRKISLPVTRLSPDINCYAAVFNKGRLFRFISWYISCHVPGLMGVGVCSKFIFDFSFVTSSQIHLSRFHHGTESLWYSMSRFLRWNENKPRNNALASIFHLGETQAHQKEEITFILEPVLIVGSVVSNLGSLLERNLELSQPVFYH